MALDIYINHSNTDAPLLTSGVDWVEVDSDNDTIIVSNGSDIVADGEATPGESALNSAGLLLTPGTAKVFPHYFLDDASAIELKEIFLMGEGNYRYVMAFDFDASTASEPVLEVWDDITMQTVNSVVLGAGTPSASWIKGITTTDALPGVDWVGTALAGSSDNHFLYCNNENGALTVAKTLYVNLKVVCPASQIDAGATTPVIVIKWASV